MGPFCFISIEMRKGVQFLTSERLFSSLLVVFSCVGYQRRSLCVICVFESPQRAVTWVCVNVHFWIVVQKEHLYTVVSPWVSFRIVAST